MDMVAIAGLMPNGRVDRLFTADYSLLHSHEAAVNLLPAVA